MTFMIIELGGKRIEFELTIDLYNRELEGMNVYIRYTILFNEMITPKLKNEIFACRGVNDENDVKIFNIVKTIEGGYYKFNINNLPPKTLVGLRFTRDLNHNLMNDPVQYRNIELDNKKSFLIMSIAPFKYISLLFDNRPIKYSYLHKITTHPIMINLSRFQKFQVSDCVENCTSNIESLEEVDYVNVKPYNYWRIQINNEYGTLQPYDYEMTIL